MCLYIRDGRDERGTNRGLSPSPEAGWNLREPVTTSSESSTAPRCRSAVGFTLPKHPCLPLSPCPSDIPISGSLTSQPPSVLIRLCCRFLSGAFPPAKEAGLYTDGWFISADFLPPRSRLPFLVPNTEEPSPIWFRRVGFFQVLSSS